MFLVIKKVEGIRVVYVEIKFVQIYLYLMYSNLNKN